MATTGDREPQWLTRPMVVAIQEAQLREHGGTHGIRDVTLLESALARPQHKFAYADTSDLALLAAAYAFGIAKNHAFVDGNKRAAFMAAYTFLGLNGFDFIVPETDAAYTIERMAAGEITEVELADWFRGGMQPLSAG